MKVAINGIVSFPQGFERPAHIRICMVKSLEIVVYNLISLNLSCVDWMN
jgi:hypothetical protein